MFWLVFFLCVRKCSWKQKGEKKKDAAFYRATYLYQLVKAADVDLSYLSFRSLTFKNKIKFTADENWPRHDFRFQMRWLWRMEREVRCCPN